MGVEVNIKSVSGNDVGCSEMTGGAEASWTNGTGSGNAGSCGATGTTGVATGKVKC